MKHLILIALIAVITLFSCNNQNSKVENSKSKIEITQDSLRNNNSGLDSITKYNINMDMTLSEVSKKNSINLNYLKSELGIPASLKHDYQLKTISKNFKFEIKDIERIIKQYHNDRIERIKNNVSKSSK
ncbi:MAG: hypothetical protein C0595_12465 [Marinilabiliales bacterium]|nr:MAG: hypothetical protein C0595_12465 [Marinilabiliales bacterium]